LKRVKPPVLLAVWSSMFDPVYVLVYCFMN